MRTPKKYPRKCAVKFCRGLAMKSGHSDKCSKHRTRQWKANHPLKYAFKKLRSRAAEREIAFSLTFEEYEAFAVKSGLARLHGKEKYCLTVDRKDGSKGYVASNIRAITASDNSSRRAYVPYFKNKAQREAAIEAENKRAVICNQIGAECDKLFEHDSDEWRAEYTKRTNAAFEHEAY